jgi:signal recognition particle subunit SRP54
MVLAQLAGSIKGALDRMCNAIVVDEKVLNDCVNEISRALLQADVRFETVRGVQASIKNTVNQQALADGIINKRRVIHRAVVAELRRMLDPGKPSFTPSKGRKPASVVMFVGLQGSGKTTTCVKYADYHRRMKGFSPALVCADTFRAGAFDQLKQNAAKAGIPFYGSHTESDPVKVAVEGVDRFRNEDGSDLIVVDTSGRHRQEAALLEEMRQVADATRPDLVVFVMDASIGQGAFEQAQAFRESAPVGAVIVTKMDGHAKGGGALSAVAATKSPVIFIGTGEHIPDLEAFDAKSFVSRLLGMGDLSGFMDKMHVIPADDNRSPYQILEQLTKKGTLRALRELFRAVQSMGPLGQLVSMIPGLISDKFNEKEGQVKIKRCMTMLDSMTDAELDGTSPKLMNQSRINRVARGSGRPVREVVDMLEEHKRMAKMMSKLPNVKRPNDINHLVNAIPQPLLNQFGGKFGLQNLIRQMGAQS